MSYLPDAASVRAVWTINMKAMILAAGYGTRLRPLTDTTPKALVAIKGVPLLEIVMRRLLAAGVEGVIINTHHLTDQVTTFVRTHIDWSIRVALSHEKHLLNTGGGLQQAGWFFDDAQPFFVHNVDVVSNIDLPKMYRYHQECGALATLAVKSRPTKRYLLFDEELVLCGRKSLATNQSTVVRQPRRQLRELAFGGIHIISPALLGMMSETGAFSIIDTYLRLASRGEKIVAFDTAEYEWYDAGKLDSLNQLARHSQPFW